MYVLNLKPEYQKGLLGLEAFSHVVVTWHAHLAEGHQLLIDKPYAKGPEKLGVFATWSQFRPNPIAITVCPIIKIEKGLVVVAYIDAENDSPVLDLKPYQGCIDRIKQVESPDWCQHWPQYFQDNMNFDWSKEFNF